MSLYIDDQGAYFYGNHALRGRSAIPSQMDWAAAELHQLLMVANSLRVGLLESWKKQAWPTNSPVKFLGVTQSFLKPGVLFHEVHPCRREDTNQLLLELVDSPKSRRRGRSFRPSNRPGDLGDFNSARVPFGAKGVLHVPAQCFQTSSFHVVTRKPAPRAVAASHDFTLSLPAVASD